MEELLNYLEISGYELEDSSVIKDDDGTITHIYTGKDDLYFLIIAPHEGNHFKYLLRANPKITFDRWSVCDFEREFTYSYQVAKYLEENTIRIYQDILELYTNHYMEDNYD